MQKVNKKTGEITCYLQMLGAAIAHPDFKEVIPLKEKRGNILNIQYSLFYFIQFALNLLILRYFLFNTIIGHCYCRTGHIAEIHITSSLHVMPL